MSDPAPAATVVLLREARGDARGAAAAAQFAARLPRRRLGLPGRSHRRAGLGRGRRRGRRAARCGARGARGGRASRSTRRALVQISHWTTPEGLPKRFATWFFLGAADATQVRVDGGEIHAHALARRRRPRSKRRRARRDRAAAADLRHALDAAREAQRAKRRSPRRARPRRSSTCRASCASTAARARSTRPTRAGSSATRRAPGPRNRLWMLESGWRYEREH